ncbi:hypothetical protein [Rhizobium mongolense]|uniref:Uncharacterized protein n=1 Tax=Rhizobium mongolense TaxID=57676 RepID=A0A7W6RLG8_9HYPH|nr:hypothetical protein [Rhizobium mongolense]MBB4273975.1 hypothetical protein [Rhizobium mongolense]
MNLIFRLPDSPAAGRTLLNNRPHTLSVIAMDPCGLMNAPPGFQHLYAAAESGPLFPPLSMRFEIHQYYGAFGFSLAIVTEKPYNDFQVRKC